MATLYFIIGILLCLIYNAYRMSARRVNPNYLTQKYGSYSTGSSHRSATDAGKGFPSIYENMIYSRDFDHEIASGIVSFPATIFAWPLVVLFIVIYLVVERFVIKQASK